MEVECFSTQTIVSCYSEQTIVKISENEQELKQKRERIDQILCSFCSDCVLVSAVCRATYAVNPCSPQLPSANKDSEAKAEPASIHLHENVCPRGII